jgi:hypothetical protein
MIRSRVERNEDESECNVMYKIQNNIYEREIKERKINKEDKGREQQKKKRILFICNFVQIASVHIIFS